MSERSLSAAIERAARDLPEGWEIRVCVEQGAGWVTLINPERDEVDYYESDIGLADNVFDALTHALATPESAVEP